MISSATTFANPHLHPPLDVPSTGMSSTSPDLGPPMPQLPPIGELPPRLPFSLIRLRVTCPSPPSSCRVPLESPMRKTPPPPLLSSASPSPSVYYRGRPYSALTDTPSTGAPQHRAHAWPRRGDHVRHAWACAMPRPHGPCPARRPRAERQPVTGLAFLLFLEFPF
jgi:hypothetical protein